jgi:hypothetical protein
VAKDFGLTALINALGGTEADLEQVKNESLRLLALQSTSICPTLAIDECELEVYRRRDGGSNCTDECNGFLQPYKPPCSNIVLPTYLWNNTRNRDLSYEERACCTADKTKNCCSADKTKNLCLLSTHAPKKKGKLWGIVASAVAVPLALLCTFMVIFFRRRNKGLMQPRLS